VAVDQKQDYQPVDPRAVAREFAARARNDPAVEQLWLFSYRNVVQLWILTAGLPAQEERRLYGLLDGMYARFPEADLRLHLVSPRYFDPLELDLILPPGAEEIALNAA
jgi:hypothetical protein